MSKKSTLYVFSNKISNQPFEMFSVKVSGVWFSVNRLSARQGPQADIKINHNGWW
jgi:hypothetical protein